MSNRKMLIEITAKISDINRSGVLLVSELQPASASVTL